NAISQFRSSTIATPPAHPALHSFPTRRSSDLFYWDDLQTEGTAIRYGTSGTSPNRTFIVDFQENRVAATGDKVNGQVQIHERSSAEEHTSEVQSRADVDCRPPTVDIQGAGGTS